MQDFSGPFPVEVITRMAGVPEDFRQQVRHWIDKSLHRKPGQIDLDDDNMQANIDSGMYYYGLVAERRENPQDDMISRLIAAEIPDDDGNMRKLDDIEITGFTTLLGGAGAETVTKLVGSAVVEFASHPEQWQKLLDDRSKIPAAVEELLRYVGPVQYNVRYSIKDVEVPSGTIPANKPVFLMGASANRDPRAFDDAETFDIDRDRTQAQNLGLGYGIHSCLGAALARMESAIALEHLLDFMPRYEVDFDSLRTRQHAERRRLPPRAGEGAAVTPKDRGRFRPVREQRGLHGHHPRGVRSRRRGLPARAAGRSHSRERAADQRGRSAVPAAGDRDRRRVTRASAIRLRARRISRRVVLGPDDRRTLATLGHDASPSTCPATARASTRSPHWPTAAMRSSRPCRPGDVLVGHSGGGFDATLAADAAPDLVSHIVYLAAALPREGRTYPEAMAMRDSDEELARTSTPMSERCWAT